LNPLVDIYDFAGLQTTQGGRLLSTHVGDDLEWGTFQEGANPPTDVQAAARHPLFGADMQLLGFGVVVLLILYMDKRIKVPFA